MYNVSTGYKTQIKNSVRNPSYIRIELEVQPDDVVESASISANSQEYYSNVADIKNPTDIVTSYQTLERNRFFLDGRDLLSKDYPITGESYDNQGFVGTAISDSVTGLFTVQPYITIDFGSNYYDFPTLTMDFDTRRNEKPSELRIVCQSDSTTVYDETYAVTKTSDYAWQDTLPLCNKITIYAVGTSVPERRFRMERLVFGIKKIFDGSNVSSFTWLRSLDPINIKLPTNTFDFTIIDKDREYDPENPDSIYNFLEKNQAVSAEIGYELDSGIIEWIDLGTHFTGSDIRIETQYRIPLVTFNARSYLGLMDIDYTEGKYYPSGRSLYDLANDVFDFAGIPEAVRVVDTSLQSLYSKMPLPIKRCHECLQLIANAGMITLRTGADETIRLEPLSDSAVEFEYELSDMINVPEVKKYPDLQGVDTFSNVITVGENKNLGEFDISGASNTVYELFYSPSTNISAVAGTGLTIVGAPEYYSEMCRITLTGTGVLSITGDELVLSKTAVTEEVNLVGERCPIENVLITDIAHANSYASWVAEYISRKNEYSFSDRGFPEIDDGDIVKFNTLSTSDAEGTVIEHSIKFNGSLSGNTKLLIK